ncbi:hypothetical protein WISP_109453 [Willisornis vidua]|uniref:Uncharacterized protein n=1 Tax=Willisornis vidua TaxID=1566151 RepID=A0ABQ9CVY5_9PASS|nr:hypothetical protein WISP_109453 [Willisornis vidua]
MDQTYLILFSSTLLPAFLYSQKIHTIFAPHYPKAHMNLERDSREDMRVLEQTVSVDKWIAESKRRQSLSPPRADSSIQMINLLA